MDDEAEVEAIYRRYGPMVVRRCRRLLRDEDEALDVAQEVFVRVVKHRGRLDHRYPSSLLFRIATNLSLNRLRDRRREPVLPGDEVLHRIARRERPGRAAAARPALPPPPRVHAHDGGAAPRGRA